MPQGDTPYETLILSGCNPPPCQHQSPISRFVDLLYRKLARQHVTVRGALVASDSFVKALFRYGTSARYEVLVIPQHKLAWTSSLESIRSKEWKKFTNTRVRSYYDLLSGECKPTVWCDLSFDFSRPAQWRRMYSGNLYPICVSHHTISYQQMLHRNYLPLLLAGSYPCDSVVCSSEAARGAISNLIDHVAGEFSNEFRARISYKGRLDVVPFGVDTDIFCPRAKEQCRARLALRSDELVILYLGYLSLAHKGDLLPFLTVFRDLLLGSKRRLRLILSGTGPKEHIFAIEQWLRTLNLKRNVTVIINPLAPHLLYSAADIFVSPVDSVQESFGLSIVEAMACGIPQVVSDWNGYKYTVRHGTTGFLVPTYWAQCDADVCDVSAVLPDDIEYSHASLAQSVVVDLRKYREYLECLIQNDDLRVEMGRRSREHAQATYSWPVVIRQYEMLWQDLSECASKLAFPARESRGYTHPKYFEAFAHYPTRVLRNPQLSISNRGRTMVGAERILPLWHPAARLGLLDENILKRTLLFMVEATQKTNDKGGSPPLTTTQPLEELVAGLGSDKAYQHPDSLRRHVMWLLKYGYLELIRDPDSEPTEKLR